ncbi:MAG: type II toxin-antitoxin system HicB family antitoxin [Oscillospiraceae bacterium]|jgi:predicted RNase H-like HicB family nuclease|nr:type II toxin-antitoxin system HicB family antitoxin [Oscillospiraceae bacterium]
MVIYPAHFHPNEDASITVQFPDLPGCITEGKNEANALFMARDALALYIDTLRMCGEPVPPPSPAQSVPPEVGSCLVFIDADPEIYARERRNRAIRRTVSIPQWMDERAASEHISLSKVLQAALAAQFQD